MLSHKSTPPTSPTSSDSTGNMTTSTSSMSITLSNNPNLKNKFSVDYQPPVQQPQFQTQHQQPTQSSFYNAYNPPQLVSPQSAAAARPPQQVQQHQQQQFVERSASSHSQHQQQSFQSQQSFQQQFQQQQQHHQYADNQYHVLTPPQVNSRPQSTHQLPAQFENFYTPQQLLSPIPTVIRPPSSSFDRPQTIQAQFENQFGSHQSLLSPVPQVVRPPSAVHSSHTPIPHASLPQTPVPHTPTPHLAVPLPPPGPRNPNFGAVGSAVLNVANPGLLPSCHSCHQIIRGPFISAIGKIWCPHHFVCAATGINLENVGFVEEQGKLYCEKYFEQHLAPICFKCKSKIVGVS